MKKVNVCIAGGASTYTPGILVGMIKKMETFPMKKLVLYDNDAKRVEKMGKYAQILMRDFYPGLELIYTTDKKEAFTDMDFIFCQIRTGGLKMREQDEKTPLKLGVIGQETCGPGGFSYGLRSIKDMIELVKDVRKYSPEAWFLNYTNPAAIVAVALDREFPNDKKILNICDQPINLQLAYAKMLDDMDHRDLVTHYFGLNHFGWITKVEHRVTKEDLTDKLRQIILKEGFSPVDKEQRDPSWLVTYNNVQKMMELDPTYLPNTYLQYYLLPHGVLSTLDPNWTRANEVMSGREKRVFDECDNVIKLNSAKNTLAIKKDLNRKDAHGDMIVEIAEAILNDTKQHYIVIVRNDDIITNFEKDAMVEVLCQLGKDGAIPFKVGEIDTYHKGLMQQQYAYEKLTVDAYYENSYLKALQALTLNRTVVDQKLAKEILDALIKMNGNYWPELK